MNKVEKIITLSYMLHGNEQFLGMYVLRDGKWKYEQYYGVRIDQILEDLGIDFENGEKLDKISEYISSIDATKLEAFDKLINEGIIESMEQFEIDAGLRNAIAGDKFKYKQYMEEKMRYNELSSRFAELLITDSHGEEIKEIDREMTFLSSRINNIDYYFDNFNQLMEKHQEFYASNKTTVIEPLTFLEEGDSYDSLDEERRKNINRGLAAAGIVGAGVLTGGAILGAKNNDAEANVSEDDIVYQYQDENVDLVLNENLLENIQNEIQSEFVMSTMKLIETFHEQTHKTENFRLEADQDKYLDFTWDEAVALNLLLNDYTDEELAQIFENYELDAISLRDNFNAAWSKLSVYYMNAIEPSGISELIKNDDARNFFIEGERVVLDFNKNPSRETAANVHRFAYYNYVISGATTTYATQYNFDARNTENKADSLVSYLTVSPLYGFLNMNSVTPKMVEEYLVTHLDDEVEKTRLDGNPAYLHSGVEFVKLFDSIYGERVVDNEDINEDFRRRGDTGIINIVDNLGLCEDVITRSEEYVNKLGGISSRSKKNDLFEAQNFLGNAVYDNSPAARQALLEATNLNNNKLDEVLKNAFPGKTIAEANGLLQKAMDSVNSEKLANLVYFRAGLVSDEVLDKIATSSQEGRDLVNVYNELVKTVSNSIDMNDIRKVAIDKVQSLDNYGANEKEAVAFLVNVRRGRYLEKDYNNYGSYDLPSTTTSKVINEEIVDLSEKVVGEETIIIPGDIETDIEYVWRWVPGTPGETYTYTEEHLEKVRFEDLTETEKEYVLQEMSKQEAELAASDINIKDMAAKQVNAYLNGGKFEFSNEVIEYLKQYDVNLREENIVNQLRMLRAWSDGKGVVDNVGIDESVINAKMDRDFNNFRSSLSEAEKKALANKYGANWETEVEKIYKTEWKNDFDYVIDKFVKGDEGVGKGEYYEKYKEFEDSLEKEFNEEEQFVPADPSDNEQDLDDDIIDDNLTEPDFPTNNDELPDPEIPGGGSIDNPWENEDNEIEPDDDFVMEPGDIEEELDLDDDIIEEVLPIDPDNIDQTGDYGSDDIVIDDDIPVEVIDERNEDDLLPVYGDFEAETYEEEISKGRSL